MTKIYFDTKDFDEKFKKIVKEAIPELIEKGLGRAMLQLLNDCIMEVPTVPIKEGWLRGSGSAFVQNKLVAVSTHGKLGMANTSYSEMIGMGKYAGIIGFNTPYAARLHEGIDMKFKEPSSGAKYLESKLIRNKESYMGEIADTIREGGNA